MTDYSDYSYSSLLEFLVKEDKYDNEGVNYADVLLSMSGAISIEEMVTVYNRVFKKISYYVFWHSLPDYWFITESWDSKQYLANELNKCYNENLLRLYKSLDNPTKDDCVTCVVNLRESDNKTKIQNEVILYKTFEDLHGLSGIIGLRDKSYSVRRRIRKLIPRTDEYTEMKTQYVDIMCELLSYGYKNTVEEDKFEGIRHIDVRKMIKRKIEKEEKRLKEKRKEKIIFYVFVIPLILVLVFIFSLIMKEIGLLGIIVIIGMLGLLPKVLLSGKI